MRVRAPTHKFLTRDELKSIRQQSTSAQAFCLGTIINYCPNIDKHFVCFDGEKLQPKWVTCEKGQVEVIPEKCIIEANHLLNACALCYCPFDQFDLVWKCEKCKLQCHENCYPDGLMPLNDAKAKSGTWKCWNCLGWVLYVSLRNSSLICVFFITL